VFFVSEHSWRLTEEQLGRKLANASIVRNPFNVPWSAEPDWPEDGTGLRLACVARLAPQEKGQDLLLRVLAAGIWRNRPVSLSFFGSGEHREGLDAMARFHGLAGVRFHGQEEDVAGIWRDHHALLLGSRAEGLPLVLVEAMLSGRVPIVTDVGGNSEVVSDGVTGFLAASPTEASIDAALEQAWQRRGEWRKIGAAAANAIRALVPPDPAADFADVLVRIADRKRDPVPS
jgi:glycosyltransferase involved in cell wall biosynthesis